LKAFLPLRHLIRRLRLEHPLQGSLPATITIPTSPCTLLTYPIYAAFTTNQARVTMDWHNSPTPRSSSFREPPPSHGTMEMRVSQNQAELQQAISARQSNRSMSTNDRDDLERRYQQLQRKQVELEQELAKCKVTIKTQSDIIQKPQSGHKPFLQPPFENGSAYPIPGPCQTPISPPRFDPSGAVATAQNILRQSNSNADMPHSRPNYGSRSTPRPAKTTCQKDTSRRGSTFQRPFHEQNITPPLTNPYPASLPAMLGYGLTTGQRAQPLSSFCNANRINGTYQVQSQASKNSYLPGYTQHSSNQLSYPSQSSCRTLPQQQAPNTTPPLPTTLVRVINTAQDFGFSAKFDALFTMSERYAFAHINFPSSAKDAMLSSYIKGKLELVAGNSAGNLMSNGQTRYHIIARVINQWISKHVLRRTCFSGLDEEIDANIEMYASSIYQSGFFKFASCN